VASTHKTLTEIEPRTPINAVNTPGDLVSTYRITQPGSYYLTGDVTGSAGRYGIVVSASDVTIDLNGFAVRGVAGAFSGIITDTSARSNVTVRRGTIRDWPNNGIAFAGSAASGAVIDDVRLISIVGQNMLLPANSRVTNCTIENAGSYGIYAPFGRTLVESCTVRNAVSYGILVFDNSVVRACSVENVNGSGIIGTVGCVIANSSAAGCSTGIYIELGSTAEGCVARNCSTEGFFVNLGSTVRGCTSSGNGATSVASGIRVAGADCRIEGNNVTGSDFGIRSTGGGNIFVRNTASGNTTNYDIVAGNFGLFVNAAPIAAAFSGSAGGVALGGTDPNGNYSY
jgi:parallel beta-helix repeat protein